MTQKFALLVASFGLAGLVGCSSASTTPAPTGNGPGTGSTIVAPDGGSSSSSGTPTTGDSGTAVGGGNCPIDTGSKTCDACMQQNCCSQLAACAADADCVALDTCLQKCGDPQTQAGQQCGDACYQQHAHGGATADAIDACGAKSCQQACR